MDAQKLVALNLKRLRLQKQVSQEELADGAGIARTYVSRLERALENPTVDVLDRLAHALEATIPDFFRIPMPRDREPKPLPTGPKRGR
ncbi:MAG: helix-turn-helix domain-containing protein [Ferrovibrio sp.]|uniref:helix-turn-helix domain-containing protein n=1 Tax=Ferrovibrio sp. TaxID=1917215 RepID=UPI00391DB3B0